MRKPRFKHSKSDYRRILGVTLSKKGWNNVLIYLVLALMFMFHFIGQDRSSQSRDSIYQPFQSAGTLVAIQVGEIRLVRVGNAWQQQSGPPLSADQQLAWIQTWQEVEVQTTEQLLEGQEFPFELTFADQTPWEGVIFKHKDRYLLAMTQLDEVFIILNEQAERLLNPE